MSPTWFSAALRSVSALASRSRADFSAALALATATRLALYSPISLSTFLPREASCDLSCFSVGLGAAFPAVAWPSMSPATVRKLAAA